MRLFFLWLILSSTLPVVAQRPNIVIIVSDDHAYQSIGAYGSKLMKTPGIDRIANEGVIFRKAYVTNSICGPSRAVLLTGKYSHKNGFRDNEHSRFDGSQDSFIKQLRAGGYLTAWIGKWHLETKPQGFDYWQVLPGQGQYYNPDFIMMDSSIKRVEGYASNVIEDAAETWLDKRDETKPFCLVIGHKATHRTWLPDTGDMGMFDKVNFPLPHNFYDNYSGREAAKVQDMTISKTMIMGYDLKMFESEEAENKEGSIKRMNLAQRAKFDAYYKPIAADFKARNLTGNALTEWKYQRYMKDYLSTAASLDRNIARTLDYLDKHNLTKNTIVIYLSDQGFYMGEHGWFDKRFIYEESFRTPMVMRYPGVIKPGTVNNDFVMNLDIGPTVLQAAGVKIPKDMQGESILPLLQKNGRGRDVVYYHYYENGEHSVSPHFGIKTKRYKLVRFYKRVSSWELYDLQKDPHEMQNLYGKKGYVKITTDLYRQLLQALNKYEDGDAKQILNDNKLPGDPKGLQ
ncbi:MAG: sulfatase [Chthoniobacter sp.]|nr:sulfatase [Chthoniobacter sp.]